MVKRYSRKQLKKLFDGKCYFCGETDYALLDAHRIQEGADGGKYFPHNIVTVCASCHRRIHAKQIIIDRKYPSSGGMVLHYWIDNKEYWEKC